MGTSPDMRWWIYLLVNLLVWGTLSMVMAATHPVILPDHNVSVSRLEDRTATWVPLVNYTLVTVEVKRFKRVWDDITNKTQGLVNLLRTNRMRLVSTIQKGLYGPSILPASRNSRVTSRIDRLVGSVSRTVPPTRIACIRTTSVCIITRLGVVQVRDRLIAH